MKKAQDIIPGLYGIRYVEALQRSAGLCVRVFRLYQLAGKFVDRVGPRKNRQDGLFPDAEGFHFLLEIVMPPVVAQAFRETVDGFFLLSREEERPSQVEIQEGIHGLGNVRIGRLELDDRFPAGRNAAEMLLIDDCLKPAAVGKDDRMVRVETQRLQQDCVGLLLLSALEVRPRSLDVLCCRRSLGGFVRAVSPASSSLFLFHGHDGIISRP